MGGWKSGRIEIFGFPSCVFCWRVEKSEGAKLFCLVGEKKGRMENVIYIN